MPEPPFDAGLLLPAPPPPPVLGNPLTSVEIQQRELDAIAAATAKAEADAAAEAREALKVSARAKLVAGQTLTEEEAAVLVI